MPAFFAVPMKLLRMLLLLPPLDPVLWECDVVAFHILPSNGMVISRSTSTHSLCLRFDRARRSDLKGDENPCTGPLDCDLTAVLSARLYCALSP